MAKIPVTVIDIPQTGGTYRAVVTETIDEVREKIRRHGAADWLVFTAPDDHRLFLKADAADDAIALIEAEHDTAPQRILAPPGMFNG